MMVYYSLVNITTSRNVPFNFIFKMNAEMCSINEYWLKLIP